MVLDLRIPLTKRYQQDVLDKRSRSTSPASSMPPRRSRPSPTAGMRSPTRPGRTPSSPRTSPALASSGSSVDRRPREPDRQRSGARHSSTAPSDRIARRVAFRRRGQMAVHLADRPVHPRPVALPARRLARPLAVEAGLRQGGVDLKFVGLANYQQLLFGLERSHFLGVLKSALAARLGDPRPAIAPDRLRLDARCAEWTLGPVRLGPAPDGRRRCWSASSWLLVQALVSEGGRPGLADRHADLRLRRDRVCSTAWVSASRCWRPSTFRGGASSGSCSSSH